MSISTLSGEVTVMPPLNVTALRNGQDFVPNGDRSARNNWVNVTYHVENGYIVGIWAVTQEQQKFYEVADHLQQAITALMEFGCACEGELVRVGEEIGDIERFWPSAVNPSPTHSQTVNTEKAEIRWPSNGELAQW
jgi:hypothetical protein